MHLRSVVLTLTTLIPLAVLGEETIGRCRKNAGCSEVEEGSVLCVDTYCTQCQVEPRKCMLDEKKCRICTDYGEGCYLKQTQKESYSYRTQKTTVTVDSELKCAKSNPCEGVKCDEGHCVNAASGDEPPEPLCVSEHPMDPCQEATKWGRHPDKSKQCFVRAAVCHGHPCFTEAVFIDKEDCGSCDLTTNFCEIKGTEETGYKGTCVPIPNDNPRRLHTAGLSDMETAVGGRGLDLNFEDSQNATSTDTSGGDVTSGGETSGGDATDGGKISGGDAIDGGETSGGDAIDGGETAGGDSTDGGKTSGGDATGGGETAGDDATDGGKTSGGDVTDGGKTSGGDVTDGGETAGGDATDGGETSGGDVTDGGETAGGDATGGGETAGDDATDGGKTSGGDVTDGGETAGGDATGGGETAGDDATDGGKTSGGDVTDGGETAGGEATDGGKTSGGDATGGGGTAGDELNE